MRHAAQIKASKGVGPLLRQRFFVYKGEPIPKGTRDRYTRAGAIVTWNWGRTLWLPIPVNKLWLLAPDVEASVLYLDMIEKESGWPQGGHPMQQAARYFYRATQDLVDATAVAGRDAYMLGSVLLLKNWSHLVSQLPGVTRENADKMRRLEKLWYAAEEKAETLTRLESEYFGLDV